MKYRLVSNPETEEFGLDGKIIYDLIKEHRPELFQQLKGQNKLIKQIQEWEKEYIEEMLSLIHAGLNQSQAREIAWPETTARFGM